MLFIVRIKIQPNIILGSDGYKADYVNVATDAGGVEGGYKCYFQKFLDGDDSEAGFNCIAH